MLLNILVVLSLKDFYEVHMIKEENLAKYLDYIEVNYSRFNFILALFSTSYILHDPTEI